MNLSRDDTNALSESLIETGAEYGVSTDKLVNAIDALKETFPAQKLAGMGSDVMEAVAQLQSELGPSLAGPLNKVMKTVMDTSEEGMATITKMGLEGVREQLSASKSADQSREILKNAIMTGSDTYKQHTLGSDTNFRMLGVAAENIGRGAIDFTTVADAFGDRTRQEIDQAADFGMTLSNLKAEALVPFQEGLAVAYPFLVKVADVLSGVANIIGQKFKAFTEGLGDGKEALKNLQLGIIDFAIMAMGKLKGVFAFMESVITEGIPMIFDKLQGAFFEFYREGGVMTKMKAVFFRVIATINDFQGMSFWDGADENAAEERAEQNRALAASMDQLVEDNKENTFEAMKEALAAGKGGDTTSPLGQLLKDAADAQDEATKNDPTIKALNKARESIIEGNGFARKTNESLAAANARLEAIDNKTPEIETKSEFLGETANMLSESIENILGIGRDTTSEEMLEELKAANMINMNKETGSSPAKAENSLNG